MIDLDTIPSALLVFVTERHLATLTTLNADGSPHVVPVGFTFDEQTGTARVITSGDSVKARNARRGGARAALCQVAGPHWLTLTGPIRVLTDAESVTDAEQRYAARYRIPRPNPRRVVLLMDVTRAMGQLP